jgi:hypothetical protein
VEMGVGEVVRANLLGERENIGPILPQGCLLEIDGSPYGSQNLASMPAHFPGAIVERDLVLKTQGVLCG